MSVINYQSTLRKTPKGQNIIYIVTEDRNNVQDLYCYNLYFEDSPNITQPTNAQIVYYILV